MSNIKRAIIIFLIAINPLALAKPVGSSPIAFSEPAQLRLGAQALYLQPTFGGNSLGYSAYSYGTDIFNNTVGGTNPTANAVTNINPNWNWGFQIEGDYLFPVGSDIDINWYHWNNRTSNNFPVGTLFAGNAPNLYAGFFQVNPKWNAINIEIGQRFPFNYNKLLHLSVGLQFVNLSVIFTNYPQLHPSSGPLFVTTDDISYKGLGPRFGGDFIYGFTPQFGIYVKSALSLLVGTAKQNVSGYPNLAFPNSYSAGNYVQSNNGVVVPELEGKLGIKYDYPTRSGVLGFDVGYQWIGYLNALVSQTGSGLAGSSVSASNAANFDMSSLCLGLTWSANI